MIVLWISSNALTVRFQQQDKIKIVYNINNGDNNNNDKIIIIR